MPKLTKRLIDSLRPADDDQFVWDDELAGFCVRVRPSGRRSFVVQYRTPERRQRRRVIGTFPTMTVDQARRAAREWLVDAQKGKDPAEAQDISRQAETVSDLCERFLAHHAALHKKPQSAREDRRIIERYIKPAMGRRFAASVTQKDVESLHKSLKTAPYQANRVLALLSTIFNMAEPELRRSRSDWVNPCRWVKRFAEEKRRRYLSSAELARLGQALATAETERSEWPWAIAAIRLLIFTGCRRSEILTLRWDEVDFEAHRLRLADSKTGAKDIYLGPPALEVLENLQRVDGNPHVIVGRGARGHLYDLKSSWYRIRAMAGLEDVRLHDLRHSFASIGVGTGLSLPIIGGLLGHTQPATTARYAHLASTPLQEAADQIGKRLADAMAGASDQSGQVFKLRRE